MVQRIILIFLTIVLAYFTSTVSAVECGSIPTSGCDITQNTTFAQGTYSYVNGINIRANNIVLDCNGSTIIAVSNDGITLHGASSNVIKNCIVRNSNHGIKLVSFGSCPSAAASTKNLFYNNTLENNTYGVNSLGGLCSSPFQEVFHNYNRYIWNYFKDNSRGISLTQYSNYNNISDNLFVNNSLYAIHTGALTTNALIYNNTFYATSIRYEATNNHEYCLNNLLPNVYAGGASGPPCGCILPLEGFTVTSNETFCQGEYKLSSGFKLSSNSALECNSSRIVGTRASDGVLMEGTSNSRISNCIIANYSNAIYLKWSGACFAPHDSSNNNIFDNLTLASSLVGLESRGIECSINPTRNEYNALMNSRLLNNSIGIRLTTSRNNNFTYSNIENNTDGFITDSGGQSNNIYYNNFLNNIVSAKNIYLANNWNVSGGNYWSDFDSSGEGCNNLNSDLFCDSPKNINGSAHKDDLPFVIPDGWLYGLHIGDVNPVQVIEDVDLVNGKRTLVRVTVGFLSLNSSETINPNVSLYWNGTFIAMNNTISLASNQSKNVDFWYTPTKAGTNMPIQATLVGTTSLGVNYTDSKIRPIKIINTRNLTLTFVAVDNKLDTEFESTAFDSIYYISKTYPIKDKGINHGINYTNLHSNTLEHNPLGLFRLLYRVHKSTLIAGERPERSVGILPSGWFLENLDDPKSKGISSPAIYPWAVLVEEDYANNGFYDHISAHELGHTYELCDEYNETDWNRQNKGAFGLSSNLCPNGDKNNDEQLDAECIPNGCTTSTLQPLNSLPDGFEAHNFMGGSITSGAWISQESYNHLLGEFNHSTPVQADKRAVISGLVNLTSGEIEFDNFYTLEGGLAENPADYKGGNYSFQIFNSGNNLMYNLSFGVSTINTFFNGSTIENNNTAFAFVVPFNFSTSVQSIVVKYNGLTKDIRNVSINIPAISLLSPSGLYSNQEILINWTASDADPNTNLNYAILFSNDNGSSYSTLAYDYNQTAFNISSSDLSDCTLCRIKILATDGVNTNYSISNIFGIDNDLQVGSFDVVYQNNTERIFRIELNNTLSSIISNVDWEFNNGQDIQISEYSFDLSASEEILFFIYNNYTQTGNYNISFKASSGNYIEREVIQITI